jgi:hypothetical protein
VFYFYNKDIQPIDNIKGRVPLARAFHSSSLVGKNMIVHGGVLQNSTVSNDLFIYQIDTKEFIFISEKGVKGKILSN